VYCTVIRVVKLKETLEFFEAMGITPKGKSVEETMAEVEAAKANGQGDHTNLFLWTGVETDATIELTHNWGGEDPAKMDPQNDRKFGHIAVGVDNIYGVCKELQDMGHIVLRPPRDVSACACLLQPACLPARSLRAGSSCSQPIGTCLFVAHLYLFLTRF
jgi:hypothetical protein